MANPNNGMLFNLKGLTYQALQRHIGAFKACTKWKSQCRNATYCVIPTIWHSWKNKTVKAVKHSLVAHSWEKQRDGEAEQRCLRQLKYSVWYHNDGYMPL